MQLDRNSSHNPGTNLPDFFYFNVLLHGIQDGLVLSFRKERKVFFIFNCKIFGGLLK